MARRSRRREPRLIRRRLVGQPDRDLPLPPADPWRLRTACGDHHLLAAWLSAVRVQTRYGQPLLDDA